MEVTPIGTIHSPFKQKLGIPRQPLLCPNVQGTIVLKPQYAREDTLRALESFSHLWLIYWCHKSDSWRETIKPPRLGGKEKVGFLATRSPHRPNPLGLSVVKLEKVNDDFSIEVSGLDILDETPLIDLKPYLPMWDSLQNANNGWVDQTPTLKKLPVDFSEVNKELEALTSPEVVALEETLCWDPRPAYSKGKENENDRTFIHTLGAWEVTWKRENQSIKVVALKKA